MLESGTVRFKNSQTVLLKNYMDNCISALVWCMWGYGFANCGVPKGGLIGNKCFFGFDCDDKWDEMYFGFVFLSTSTTIVSGSLAERVNVANYFLFSFLQSGFVFPLIFAWVWGGGWLSELGFKDYAGSAVVHLTAGVAGLIGAKIIGPRLGRYEDSIKVKTKSSQEKELLFLKQIQNDE